MIKGIRNLLDHCVLTEKAKIIVCLPPLAGLVLCLVMISDLDGWYAALGAIYVVPACLICVWLTLITWFRLKTTASRGEARKVQKQLLSAKKAVWKLTIGRDYLSRKIHNLTKGQSINLQVRTQATAEMQTIIKDSLDPRMFLTARDVLLEEAKGLGESRLFEALKILNDSKIQGRSELDDLRREVYRQVLIDLQTGQRLVQVEELQIKLNEIQHELTLALSDRDRLRDELQSRLSGLRALTVSF